MTFLLKLNSLITDFIDMEIVPLKYKKPGMYGDFLWMIENKDYDDSIFLFNENVESFYNGYKQKGKGNAVIRPYRYVSPQRAFPIPTGYMFICDEGYRGGFQELDFKTKKIIDDAFYLLEKEIESRKDVKRIFYACSEDGMRLGTSLFKVDHTVLDYITNKIYNLK